MRRTVSTERYYCHDPACEGWHGFQVPVIPATWTQPSELAGDTCPHCGDHFYEHPIDERELTADALDQLVAAGFLTSEEEADVDELALTAVILTELKRQRSENARLERERQQHLALVAAGTVQPEPELPF